MPVSASRITWPVGGNGNDNRANDTGGCFINTDALSFADITDGLSNTIMVAEADGTAGTGSAAYPVWASPGDADTGARRSIVRAIHTIYSAINRNCTASGGCGADGFSSRHPTGTMHLFADGSVHFISETVETGTVNYKWGGAIGADHVLANGVPNGVYTKLAIRFDGQVVGDY